MAKITLKGNAVNTNGDLPKIGSVAPDFKLVNKDLQDVVLAQFAGKRKLLNIVPSLDTAVCLKSTQEFNTAASAHKNLVVLVISGDLPFAMSRVCSEGKFDNVTSLSMMRSRNFAKDYGVLINDGPLAGITARAVVVLDENNKVLYTELVPEITQEPNYQKALAAVK